MKSSLNNQNTLIDSHSYLFENNKKSAEITNPDEVSKWDVPESDEIKTYSENDPIELLELPRRIEHALDMHADINTVGKFYSYPESELYKLRNLGPKSVDYLIKIKSSIQIPGYNPVPIAHEVENLNPVNNLQVNKGPSSYDSSIPTPFNYLSLNDTYLPSSMNKNDLLEVLSLPIRLENSLKYAGGITTVGQLCDVTDKDLFRMNGIGGKSVNYLMGIREKIKEKFGTLTVSNSVEESNEVKPEEINIPENQLVTVLLERCGDERAREVIIRRYGVITGDRQTLEEIGESYKVTRERIRQIQMKSLNKMKHPITLARKPLIELMEKVLFRNGGILSAEEADIEVPKALGGITDDGSSVLDLLCDLSWIQSCKIGDITIYSPRFEGGSLTKLSEKIIALVKTDSIGIDNMAIVEKIDYFRKIKDERFDSQKFILRYCEIDPRIEEIGLTPTHPEIIVRHYTSGHFAKKGWVALMTRVLEEEQTPLHFTEIAHRVNDLISNSERQLDVRRAHSILIESESFAHSGIHGTYGLTAWGLRRETTSQLIDECLKKAGFPLHWKQIYNYVSKYKDSKPGSIISILENRPQRYQKTDSGTFGFKEHASTSAET